MVEEEKKDNGLIVPAIGDDMTQFGGSQSNRSRISSRAPRIRKVNGYIIFYDDVIGQGQFGTVCKA